MSNIDVKEIGQQLKEARIAKSMSVEEVAKITKLKKDQVIAIEEGDVSKLPPGPYVKGFIKLYYKAVGLEFVDNTAATSASHVESPARKRVKRKPMKRSSLGIDYNGIIFFTVFLLVLTLAAYLTISYFTTPKSTIDVPNGPPVIIDDEDLEDQDGVVEDAEDSEQDVEDDNLDDLEPVINLTVEDSTYYYSVTNQEELEVQLIIEGSCWIDIKVDGETSSFMTGTITDDEITIEAFDEIFIRTGYARSATIVINGEEVDFSDFQGRRDAVITLEKNGE